MIEPYRDLTVFGEADAKTIPEFLSELEKSAPKAFGRISA